VSEFSMAGCCDICGEFECDSDHNEDDIDEQDDDWMFDGSGMVGDD
jgi:hypothetical protein